MKIIKALLITVLANKNMANNTMCSVQEPHTFL